MTDTWIAAFEANQRRIAAHPSFPALVHAVAAVEAPDRFWALRDRLYPNIPSWSMAPKGLSHRLKRRAWALAERIGADITDDKRYEMHAQAYVLARRFAQHRLSGKGVAP